LTGPTPLSDELLFSIPCSGGPAGYRKGVMDARVGYLTDFLLKLMKQGGLLLQSLNLFFFFWFLSLENCNKNTSTFDFLSNWANREKIERKFEKNLVSLSF
jgi:hypothetical protein